MDEYGFDYSLSYVGEDGIILKTGVEHLVRECDLGDSYPEIRTSREKFQPWVNAGFIAKKEMINPENPPEKMFCYTLTEEGRTLCNLLQPSRKQSQTN
jgi:hypothetical protein